MINKSYITFADNTLIKLPWDDVLGNVDDLIAGLVGLVSTKHAQTNNVRLMRMHNYLYIH